MKPKILILIRPFWKKYAKHKAKFDMIKAFEEFADLSYWYEDGDIRDILGKLRVKPDFIFHYDVGYNYALAPNITGLHSIDIPKGCFIIDSHYNPAFRKNYVLTNKFDAVFSVSKENFLNSYPELQHKFKWLPWSVNTKIYRDWKQNKEYDYLLMGLINTPTHGRYKFREAVLNKFNNLPNFTHIAHPGHLVSWDKEPIVDIKYAKEINKAKIFFTCGSNLKYPILKFFEVPACKTLLIAEPNNDILELGFKDAENFIACNFTNFEEKAKYYLNNNRSREEIINNGYHFIQRNHSNQIRAHQFVNSVKDIILKKR